MSEVERKPIQVETEAPATIKLIEPELELSDFIPRYQYKFDEGEVLEESQHMFESFQSFLEVNQELITNQSIQNIEEYSKGFKQAIALCRLWIDSIYLVNRGKE